MKRSEFIKDMMGALASVVIGSKLDILPIPGKPEEVRFVLHVAPGTIQPYNILQAADGRQFYVNTLLEAVLIENPAIRAQLVEDPDIKPTAIRLYSAHPEKSTVKALYPLTPKDCIPPKS